MAKLEMLTPIIFLKKRGTNIYFFFDGNEQTVYDIKSVMETPFIAGFSLNQIADKLIITDW